MFNAAQTQKSFSFIALYVSFQNIIVMDMIVAVIVAVVVDGECL